jgi:hypothetical protein
MTVKALVGYDVHAGLTREEYDRWLFGIHLPDLLANPHLDRVVLNTVVEPVPSTSGSDTTPTQAVALYRVAELHFADMEQYRRYRRWFEDHPIPPERSPAGRSDFRFYVVCDSVTVTR